MHRWATHLRLREPRVSRGIHSRAREAFQALLTRRQPGHRRRSDAEELRAAEAASRRMAGAAVVNGFGKAADLPGVHRGRIGVSEALGAACARTVLSACACRVSGANHVESVERLHQRLQGTGTNSTVQGNGEAGGFSAIRPPSVTPTAMSAYGS